MKTVVGRKLFSVADVAKRLSLTSKTINKLIHAGELPSKRIGKSWYVSETHLVEYVEGVDNAVDHEEESSEAGGGGLFSELVAHLALPIPEEGYEYRLKDGYVWICPIGRGRVAASRVIDECVVEEEEPGWSYVFAMNGSSITNPEEAYYDLFRVTALEGVTVAADDDGDADDSEDDSAEESEDEDDSVDADDAESDEPEEEAA